MKSSVPAVLFALFLMFHSETRGATAPVSVTSTYLYDDQTFSIAGTAVPVSLASLGILPNTTIRLHRLGDYQRGNEYADDSTDLVGVFSQTSEILNRFSGPRVPGAVDAGVEYVTRPTYTSQTPTDIPQDFLIDDLLVVVPPTAHFLFLTTDDSPLGDNTDPDGDFRLELTVVPEPATCLLAALGLIMLLPMRQGGRRA